MMVKEILKLQKIPLLRFEFLTIKLNYTHTGASKVSQCFLIGTQALAWAPWGEKLGGAENAIAEGKVRAAAGQTEPALCGPPPPHSTAASGLLSGKGASLRRQPISTRRLLIYLHRWLPSPGKLGLCKHSRPLASIRWMLTSACCQGEKLRPRVGKKSFQPEQTNAGNRKGRQVFRLPTGLSGYQAAFVLSDLLLTGIKPLGFSL